MRFVRWAVILLTGTAFAVEPAGTLYDNLNTTVRSYIGVADNGGLYNSFSTGSATLNLTDVKVKLEVVDGPTQGGSVTIALYADSGNMPGAALATIGSITDSAINNNDPAGNGANYDFAVSPGISLSANTRYWIGITTSSSSDIFWARNEFTDGGFGISGQYYCYGSAPLSLLPQETRPLVPRLRLASYTPTIVGMQCYANDQDPFLMFVLGTTPSTSVPALSPVALVALGLLLLAIPLWMIRRKYRSEY